MILHIVTCEKYKKLPFAIDVVKYEKNNFIRAFSECVALIDDDIERLSKSSYEYGKRFSIKTTCKQISDIMNYIDG